MNTRIEKACYQMILNSGTVPKEALERIYQEAEGGRFGFSDLLIQSNLLKENDVLQIYSKALGMPVLDLKTTQVEKDLISKIPIKFAGYYKFFPVRLHQKKLQIAVSRLMDVNMLDEIRLALGYEIQLALAKEKDIQEMLKRHYGLGAEMMDKILSQASGPIASSAFEQTAELEDIEKLAESASVVQLVNQIILDAYRKRASDIHIEPFRGKVRLRYRIDGVLHEASVPPEMKQFFSSILSRIKIMANLNIVEKRLPQDGKARVKTQDQSLDLRISSIPTPLGESMVIRILPSKMIYNLEELGLEPENLAHFKSLLKKPYGIIFVTGPTGSGKSTTLYAGLGAINTAERKIVTIEDPIEYEMEGITQIQVMPEIGLTFARGLRSMLRHDPDVMMVGEVRDLETADIAIRVALTGHLILSTLHTNDAASGITRLLDIGIEPYLISSSVVAFMAQRLIRVICPHCKAEDETPYPEARQMILEDMNLNSLTEVKIYHGKGCDECFNTGFSGRISIHELILLNEEIRQMIFARSPASQIKERAKELGMVTLRQDGWRKVLRGITTPEEVIRATSAEAGGMLSEESSNFGERIKIEKPQLTVLEQRKYERIKIKAPLMFRILEFQDTVFDFTKIDKPFFHADTENLSAGGLFFVTRHALRTGMILEIKLNLIEREAPIECLGKVLRITRTLTSLGPDGTFEYKVAVPFLSINSVDRSKIETFCQTGKAVS